MQANEIRDPDGFGWNFGKDKAIFLDLYEMRMLVKRILEDFCTIPTGAAWRRPARLPGHRLEQPEKDHENPPSRTDPPRGSPIFSAAMILHRSPFAVLSVLRHRFARAHPIKMPPTCKDKMNPCRVLACWRRFYESNARKPDR